MRRGFALASASIVLAVLLAGCGPVGGREEYRESFRQSYSLQRGGQVSLKNVNGRVSVSTWDKDEVLVEAEKMVRASSVRAARRAAKRLRIEVDDRPSAVIISTRYPQVGSLLSRFLGGGMSLQVRYRLTVPRQVDLSVGLTNGRIEIEGVRGRVEAKTVNGSARLNDCSGSVRGETVNGAVRARVVALDPSDYIEMHTINGSVHLYLPEDVGAEIKARTVNGRVRLSIPNAEVRKSSRKRLEAQLGGGGARIDLSVVNGSIEIRPLR